MVGARCDAGGGAHDPGEQAYLFNLTDNDVISSQRGGAMHCLFPFFISFLVHFIYISHRER